MSNGQRTMKAARLYGKGDLRVERVDKPSISADDEVLIRIHACGICPSDIRAYTGLRPAHRPTPYTPGHEWTGEVVDAGEDVEGFAIGDRVVPSWRVVCGQCHYCIRGIHNYCENLRRGRVRGGFAEYGVAAVESLLKIPKSVSYQKASFCEPLACCINGSLDSDIAFGDDVAIIGAGPIGLTHLQLAKRAGARVHVSDLLPERLAKAKELGADEWIDASRDDPVERIKERTDGYGADVVIVAVGAPRALEQALDMVGICGTVNFFAGTYPPTTLAIDPNFVHYKQVRLTGSHDYTPRHFEMALRFIEIETVQVVPLISHELSLDRIVSADKGVFMPAQEGYLLAIDVGTTTTRCLLFDLKGNPIAEAYREPQIYHPQPNWMEADPEDWWHCAVTVIREVIERAQVPRQHILGVGLCGLKHALVPIDANGRSLARAMLWMDQRCQPQAEWMTREHGDLIRECVGGAGTISTTPSAPKLRWIAEHDPDLLRRTKKFLPVKDFIRLRLTGTIATDPSDASGTRLYDPRSGDWSRRLLELIDVSPDKMPSIHDATHIAGGITKRAAQATGLAPGTPVAIGGGDVQCTLVGANARASARACLYLGTAAWVSLPPQNAAGDASLPTTLGPRPRPEPH
jgi:L-iditol 2-dehydrogenase